MKEGEGARERERERMTECNGACKRINRENKR